MKRRASESKIISNRAENSPEGTVEFQRDFHPLDTASPNTTTEEFVNGPPQIMLSPPIHHQITSVPNHPQQMFSGNYPGPQFGPGHGDIHSPLIPPFNSERGYGSMPLLYRPNLYFEGNMPLEYPVGSSQAHYFSTIRSNQASPVNAYSHQYMSPNTTPSGPPTNWHGPPLAQPYYHAFPGGHDTRQEGVLDNFSPRHPNSMYFGSHPQPPPRPPWSSHQVPSPQFAFQAHYVGSSRGEKMTPTEPWATRNTKSARPARPNHISRVKSSEIVSSPTRVMSTSKDDTGQTGLHSNKERKDYHPQAPSKRSDWVMWVGNVPSNVSHEELWRFFNTTIPTSPDQSSKKDMEPWKGPSSIFLISRSSCAFVNFSSQEDLDRAMPFFNGMSIRPWDPRCPRMVCRVRRKDDDLRAGVGAQRGVGMHKSWVQQQETKDDQEKQSFATDEIKERTAVDESGRRPSIEVSQHEGDSQHKSSASFASTNSSFLARHFPKRYFILKSLTAADLEASIKSGLWQTQKHNEPVLDQAFRTSQEVILIFGANRSGQFGGYAKMLEPINRNKTSERPSITNTMRTSLGSGKPERISEEDENADENRPHMFLSPSQGQVTTTSPGQLSPEEELRMANLAISSEGGRKSDPAPLVVPSSLSPRRNQTLDPMALVSKHGAVSDEQKPQPAEKDEGTVEMTTRDRVANIKDKDDTSAGDQVGDAWSHPFRVEWIRTVPLSFNRTRYLRNPWNGDREVKVSRDGTEVEPGVGALLLAEWDRNEGSPDLSKGSSVAIRNPPQQQSYPPPV